MSHDLPKNPGGGEVDPRIGFAPDYKNAWNSIGSFLKNVIDKSNPDQELKDILIKQMTRVRGYTEYIRSKYNKTEAEKIMIESKSEVVQFLDNLAETYNQEIEQILATKNWDKLRDYWLMLNDLIDNPRK